MQHLWVCDSDYWGLKERIRKKRGGRLIRWHLIALLITDPPHYIINSMKAIILLNYCLFKANPTDLVCLIFRYPGLLLRERGESGHAAFLKIKFHVAIYQKVIAKDPLK